jgi:hypothetical protein
MVSSFTLFLRPGAAHQAPAPFLMTHMPSAQLRGKQWSSKDSGCGWDSVAESSYESEFSSGPGRSALSSQPLTSSPRDPGTPASPWTLHWLLPFLLHLCAKNQEVIFSTFPSWALSRSFTGWPVNLLKFLIQSGYSNLLRCHSRNQVIFRNKGKVIRTFISKVMVFETYIGTLFLWGRFLGLCFHSAKVNSGGRWA